MILENEVIKPRNHERDMLYRSRNPYYRYDLEPFRVCALITFELCFFSLGFNSTLSGDFMLSIAYVNNICIYIFQVRRKDFYLLSAVTKLLREFIPKLSHEADGLIFQVLGKLDLNCNSFSSLQFEMLC